jgi:hypothetical protein
MELIGIQIRPRPCVVQKENGKPHVHLLEDFGKQEFAQGKDVRRPI